MNATAVRKPRYPELSWWLMLACVISTGVLGNWFVAAGILVAVLVNAFRPFDFVAAYLLTTVGATFVYYEGGRLTAELSLLTGAICLMLVCYTLRNRSQILTLKWTPLTLPISAYVLLSAANFVRGVLSGHPAKSLGLELLPVLAIGTSLLVANGFDWKRDLRLLIVGLIGIAYGSAAMGFYVFAIIHTHTSGVYFNATPGLIALLLVNLALRARTVGTSLAWIGLSLPLYLHQFLSFRRSLWVGGMVGMLTTILIYAAGRGRERWSRVGLVLGILVGIGAVGAISLDVVYGQGDILQASVGRFATISKTEDTYDTRSNVIRLVEAAGVINLIRQSPWIGHGLGYTFVVSIPMQGIPRPQFWMDENYLLIWLKQGVIGVFVLIWVFWAGFRLGLREARSREDPSESSWFATLAATMTFMALFCLTDWPFGQVNPTFLLALFFGVAMALSPGGRVRLRWSPSTA
jgi:O-antigen ligase/polysaccharide polymerase Wzy-like membrane protein